MNLLKLIANPRYRFDFLCRRGMYKNLVDDAFLKKAFKIKVGRNLDLQNPRTYNEKLQWLKLYNHDPRYTTLVDKYEVKSYVADKIGEEYLIPTLGVWDRFEDIDFSSLPEQFVLKCTHDSGGLVICKDRESLDKDAAKRKIVRCLNQNFYFQNREWPYKNVRPRIIAEQYMEDSETADLRDYKFFCFDGEVKSLYVATDRQTPGEEVKFDFFDTDYNHIDVRNGHQNAKQLPQKPKCFEQMKELAAKLSQGIPHVRVDLYEVNGKVYFGEMTFFHMSGFASFEPEEWDYRFGEWLKLPPKQD